MARSFGKKNIVSKNIFDYNIMLLGEPGVGKTTTIANVMRKFCNDDQYLVLQVGKEDGCKAIQDLMWDSVGTWKEFTAFVDEVVKNREDWGDLKCVVIDTIDQLIDICAPHVIKEWNSSNMGKKDFQPAKTLNQAWGGFGKADEYLMSIILDQIWKLKSVGVSVFIIGHTRRRDNVDPVSGLTFSTLSASIPLRDFDALKTKMDVVSIAYIDREMTSKEFGRENIMTKKKGTINEVSNEARKIAFRSSAYVLDSKSRFPDIIDEIPMDADAFVKAIQDAIDAAAGVSTPTPAPKPSKPAPAPVVEPEVEEDEPEDDAPFDADEFAEEETETEMEYDFDAIRTEIRNKHKAGTPEQKKEMKDVLAATGHKFDEINDIEVLKKMLSVFE